MSNLTTNPHRAAADGQRARVVADAVVSAYINEIAVPARRHERGRSRPSAEPEIRFAARTRGRERRLSRRAMAVA